MKPQLLWSPSNANLPFPGNANSNTNFNIKSLDDAEQQRQRDLDRQARDNINDRLTAMQGQLDSSREALNNQMGLYNDNIKSLVNVQGMQGIANMLGLALVAKGMAGLGQNNAIPQDYKYPTGTTPASGDIWYLVHKNESGGDYGAETNLPGEFSIGRRQSNVLDGGLDYIYNYVLAHKDSIKGADQFINAFSPLRINGSFINADRNAISKAHKAAVAGGYWQGAEDAATQYKYFDEPMSRLNPEVRDWVNSALPLQQFFTSRSVQTGQGAIANRLNALYKKHGGNTAKILDEFYSPEYNDTVIFKPTNKFRVNKPQAYWNMTRGPKGRFVSERSYLRNLGY